MHGYSKTGIIGGGNLYDTKILKEAKEEMTLTPYGRVHYYLVGNQPLIIRHGIQRKVPPHRINHKANIFAMEKLAVRYIFSFNSVGSLKKVIKPGDFLIVDDYINFNPVTFYDDVIKHISPEISPELIDVLSKILKKLNLKFHQKGIYFQTSGPRLETKAEINLIKNFADIVGMTMASEATLAKEMDLEYASLCSVDNYANGISENTLLAEDIMKNQSKMTKNIEKIIKEIAEIKI